MKLKLLAAGAALLLCSTGAQAMDAETFYVKGRALKQQGIKAMFSKDMKPMIAVFEAAAKSVKAENKLAKEDGDPFYCGEGKKRLSPERVIAEFGTIPQERRRTMTVRAAWREIAIRAYPC